MKLPEKILLSDLLRHKIYCDQGIDNGTAIMVWMYPPVHRILGLITKRSNLNLERQVWKLNQIKKIDQYNIYIKGPFSISDQATLDRFPSLVNADIFNNNGIRLGLLADLVFNLKTGNILYYLVSRTNPKLPGTSRWRLPLNLIYDQQPGMVSCKLSSLDDLPIEKASIRQDFLIKSKKWKEQLNDITYQATDKLEGWLDESSFQNDNYSDTTNLNSDERTTFNEWIDESESYQTSDHKKTKFNRSTNDSDPWI